MKTSSGFGPSKQYETKPAKVASGTISGLAVYSSMGRWKTVIIPLSLVCKNKSASCVANALDQSPRLTRHIVRI